MNGDHYEEEICPTCGLGMATECRGHDALQTDAAIIAKLERELATQTMLAEGRMLLLEGQERRHKATLEAITKTPHFYDMPDEVRELVKKALGKEGA